MVTRPVLKAWSHIRYLY